MEEYIACLLEGGRCISYEIGDGDVGRLERSIRWERETEDWRTERYYDTDPGTLAENGCVFQLNEIDSGGALLTLRFAEGPPLRRFLDRMPDEAALPEAVGPELRDELKEKLGISVRALYCVGSVSSRSRLCRVGESWLVLSREMVHGLRQASLMCISPALDRAEPLLDSALRNSGVKPRSELSRLQRLREALGEEL